VDDQKIMDKETRNTLRNAVTQCRRILEEAVGERLEGQYGIHASGKIEADAHMGHLSRQDADYRGQLLVHVGHIQAGGYTAKEAVAQLAREVAFTHLNRLVAYKMMERRGLIREAVSRGVKSQGFLFYLADHPGRGTVMVGRAAGDGLPPLFGMAGADVCRGDPAVIRPP
jgi:hypothetical protein